MNSSILFKFRATIPGFLLKKSISIIVSFLNFLPKMYLFFTGTQDFPGSPVLF